MEIAAKVISKVKTLLWFKDDFAEKINKIIHKKILQTPGNKPWVSFLSHSSGTVLFGIYFVFILCNGSAAGIFFRNLWFMSPRFLIPTKKVTACILLSLNTRSICKKHFLCIHSKMVLRHCETTLCSKRSCDNLRPYREWKPFRGLQGNMERNNHMEKKKPPWHKTKKATHLTLKNNNKDSEKVNPKF